MLSILGAGVTRMVERFIGALLIHIKRLLSMIKTLLILYSIKF